MPKPLPVFFHFRTIDSKAFISLTSLMRWMALIALTALLSGECAFGQNPPPSKPKVPTSRATPKAEPADGQNYARPKQHEGEGPSEADRGPVQRHFILASSLDDLTAITDEDGNLPTKDKIALDKRLSVPLIHDVQNDGTYKAAGNHALQFEIEYLNWGAVTEEQRNARRGHYFTITWKNGGPKGDFTTRFQFRQVGSKEVVRTMVQKAPQVSGGARAYFAVVDKAYAKYGPVNSWRFTVLKGDTVVAEAKSFIW